MKRNIYLIIGAIVFVLMGVCDMQASYGKKHGGHGHGGHGGKSHGGHGGHGHGHGWYKYRKWKGHGYHGHKKASAQYAYIKDWVDKKVAEATKAGKTTISLDELKKMFEADAKSKEDWKKLAKDGCAKFKEEKKKAAQAAVKAKIDAQAKKIAQAVTTKAKGAELTEEDIAKAVAEELNKEEAEFIKGPGKKYCKWVWGKKGQAEPADIKDALAGKGWHPHHHKGFGHGGGHGGKYKHGGGHGGHGHGHAEGHGAPGKQATPATPGGGGHGGKYKHGGGHGGHGGKHKDGGHGKWHKK